MKATSLRSPRRPTPRCERCSGGRIREEKRGNRATLLPAVLFCAFRGGRTGQTFLEYPLFFADVVFQWSLATRQGEKTRRTRGNVFFLRVHRFNAPLCRRWTRPFSSPSFCTRPRALVVPLCYDYFQYNCSPQSDVFCCGVCSHFLAPFN